MLRKIALIAVVAAIATPALAAKERSTDSSREAMACGGDSRRLCRTVANDQTSILSCLQTNRARLSRACKGVLASYGL